MTEYDRIDENIWVDRKTLQAHRLVPMKLSDPENWATSPNQITAQWIDELYEWSKEAYGPGKRTQGVLDHIRKELKEIEADPDDLEEWIDVILLALNGAQRLDQGGQAILDKLFEKVAKNKARKWPDWRTADPNKAIQHEK